MPLRCQILYWGVIQRAHSLAGQPRSEMQKTARDFTQLELRVLQQGGAESVAFAELKAASIHIPESEYQWEKAVVNYGVSKAGLKRWRPAAPRIAAVRKELSAAVDAAEWAGLKLRPDEPLLDYLIRRSKLESSYFTDSQYRAGRPQGHSFSSNANQAGAKESGAGAKESGAGANDLKLPGAAARPGKSEFSTPEAPRGDLKSLSQPYLEALSQSTTNCDTRHNPVYCAATMMSIQLAFGCHMSWRA